MITMFILGKLDCGDRVALFEDEADARRAARDYYRQFGDCYIGNVLIEEYAPFTE